MNKTCHAQAIVKRGNHMKLFFFLGAFYGSGALLIALIFLIAYVRVFRPTWAYK